MSDKAHPAARAAAAAAALVQLAAVAVYLGVMAASGPDVDGLRAVPIAALFAAPAVLALAGLHGRAPLLLVATLAAGVLAVFPLSLHSFVLAPVAVVYALAYARLPTSRHHRGAVWAVIGCPVLLVAAFVVLIVQEHPACYEELETGELVVDRDPGDTLSGGRVIGPDSDVVATGCTSDIIVWWEATASLALTSAAITTGLLLVPTRRRKNCHSRAACRRARTACSPRHHTPRTGTAARTVKAVVAGRQRSEDPRKRMSLANVRPGMTKSACFGCPCVPTLWRG